MSRSTSSGSLAVPVTGIGRVCGVSASSAPSVTTTLAPRSSTQASSSAQNERHFMLGSMPRTRMTSRSRSGGDADEDLGAGPRQRAVAALVGADQRPVDLEVVVLVGVDRGDHAAVPDPDQVVHGRRGGVGGVVPPLEGGDDDGVHQVRHAVDLDHFPSLGPRSAPPGCPARRVARSAAGISGRLRPGVTMWESGPPLGRCSQPEASAAGRRERSCVSVDTPVGPDLRDSSAPTSPRS